MTHSTEPSPIAIGSHDEKKGETSVLSRQSPLQFCRLHRPNRRCRQWPSRQDGSASSSAHLGKVRLPRCTVAGTAISLRALGSLSASDEAAHRVDPPRCVCVIPSNRRSLVRIHSLPRWFSHGRKLSWVFPTAILYRRGSISHFPL